MYSSTYQSPPRFCIEPIFLKESMLAVWLLQLNPQAVRYIPEFA